MSPDEPDPDPDQHDLYSIEIERADGSTTTLEEHRGQVLLIVNVASKCGFTPQYEGLQVLHRDLHERGFSVLAFPCNQFAGQEPKSNAEVVEFCRTTYDVTFPVFAKIDVNGSKTHPLFRLLKHQAPGVLGTRAIKWNFTKFLVDSSGRALERYGSALEPAKIRKDIEALLEGQMDSSRSGATP